MPPLAQHHKSYPAASPAPNAPSPAPSANLRSHYQPPHSQRPKSLCTLNFNNEAEHSYRPGIYCQQTSGPPLTNYDSFESHLTSRNMRWSISSIPEMAPSRFSLSFVTEKKLSVGSAQSSEAMCLFFLSMFAMVAYLISHIFF